MKLARIHSHLPRRSLLFFALGLFALSFVSQFFFRSKPSVETEQVLLQQYLAGQQKQARALVNDSLLMRKLVQQSYTLEELEKVTSKNFGFFLYAETISESPALLFWNTQKIIPPAAEFSLPDGIYFRKLLNGYYVLEKSAIKLSGMSNNVIVYVLIPVLHQYSVKSPYLPTQFAHNASAHEKIALGTPGKDPTIELNGKPVFAIKGITHGMAPATDLVTVFLRLAAFILLLVYAQLFAESIRRKKSSELAVAVLAVILLVARSLVFFFPALFSFRQFDLFDPSVYASSFLNRSLGDLLINAIFLCWVVLFAWHGFGPVKQLPSFFNRSKKYGAGVVAVFLLVFFTFQFATVVHQLVVNSKISFNVTEFFTLDGFTVVGFVILALLALAYYYFSRFMFWVARLVFPSLVHIYFAVGIIGLIFLTARTGNDVVLFHLPVLLWLIAYTIILSREGLVINRFRITVAGILFWVVIFSVSLSILIVQGNRQREWAERKAMAEKYDQLTDPNKERTLSIALAYLDNHFLKTNFSRFRDPVENRAMRDSIINENFPGYRLYYNTEILVFDSVNQPLNNRSRQSFDEINTILNRQSRPTGIAGLYFHESSYDQFTYITKREVRDSSHYLGSFFILSTPREYQDTDELFADMFTSANENDLENSDLYSYAVYIDGKLTRHSTKYPFPIYLQPSEIPAEEVVLKEKGDFDELWYRASTGKVVVVVKKKDSLMESITLFSYLFCAFLVMVGLLQVFSLLVQVARSWRQVSIFSRLNIRYQIHGTVIFISVLSFLIIGIATITFFVNRYNRNNTDRLSRIAGITVNQINQNASSPDSDDDIFQLTDTTGSPVLENLVEEIADVHGLKLNVYDLSGNLQAASDESMYERGVLSNKMNPEAYFHLGNRKEVQMVHEEEISSLTYLSIYTSVRDEQGNPYAYLNIPYFTSQLDLKQEISNFIVTIINLNAFIFLIAGLIALFITNRITRSFSVIGNKMKEITLGKTNEEIVWKKNDEIGELVKQYNKMVHQLEKSAQALAKSEREGAWREMARQVAHEIKNPLTPMKLSIQYLQKAIQNNQTNVQQLTENVATTLIEQIEHLSKIAADFSQFANIGNKNVELIDLHTVLGSLVDLYSSNPRNELSWQALDTNLLMRADKTHMNRLFTNLLTNAVDACSERSKCIVQISEKRRKDYVIISITDNGDGIPEEMQAKIFTPNFTTKSSGTGLGLAMCKNIVEQAGGSIWFNTTEGVGTTFFVQLPVLEATAAGSGVTT